MEVTGRRTNRIASGAFAALRILIDTPARLETRLSHSKQKTGHQSDRHGPNPAFTAFATSPQFLIAKMRRVARRLNAAITTNCDFLIANQATVLLPAECEPANSARSAFRAKSKFSAAVGRDCAKLFPFNPQERPVLP